MRYFLDIAYKGTDYHGWQKQNNAITVQSELEKTLRILLGIPVETLGSGRTDTGVHAQQQIIHFDVPRVLDAEKLVYKLNALLPKGIAAKKIWPVPFDAHARFDAVSRSYQYHLITEKTPFLANEHYFYSRPLDVERMNTAAKLLLQYTDFESFSKIKTEVNNFVCHISRAEWERFADNHLVFHISANRFLRGMVRAIVGTLLEVGIGRMTPEQFAQIIESKDRQKAGRAAPPEGLFLSEVVYPPHLYLSHIHEV